MNIYITEPGIKEYPPHTHEYWEIITYSEGMGYLYTPDKNYHFKPGTVIIVPPHTVHGSVSESGFVNISMGGSFENIIFFDLPVVVCDGEDGECRKLAEIIYNNRFSGEFFLTKICTAYVSFLLEHIRQNSDIAEVVDKVILKITSQAFDSNVSICKILSQTGYAEDYIRSHFKKITGKTPTQFLNDTRMKRAAFLTDIYGTTLSLAQIAEKCGFEDYIYFSKQFKAKYGVSPREYLKKHRSV